MVCLFSCHVYGVIFVCKGILSVSFKAAPSSSVHVDAMCPSAPHAMHMTVAWWSTQNQDQGTLALAYHTLFHVCDEHALAPTHPSFTFIFYIFAEINCWPGLKKGSSWPMPLAAHEQ